MVDNGFVRLTHREADPVLRVAGGAPAALVGRRIAPVKMSVYGSTARLRGRPLPLDVVSEPWVRWDQTWRMVAIEQWIEGNVPPEHVRARVNTSLGISALVATGVGVAFMPCYVGDADPRFQRAAPIMDFGLSLWLLTHEDLRYTARVRVLLRFIGDALSGERGRFEGEGFAGEVAS
jgi:DNA-binding transcriptional LysR family regulator